MRLVNQHGDFMKRTVHMFIALICTFITSITEAGVMIGGGNNIPEAERFSNDELVNVLRGESVFVAIQYLNLIVQRIPKNEIAPYYTSKLKQMMMQKDYYFYSKIKIEFKTGIGNFCLDPNDGSNKDATASIHEDKYVLCFSLESIRSKVSKDDYSYTLYPLLVHEIVHLYGFDEMGAEFFERESKKHFRKYDELNLGRLATENVNDFIERSNKAIEVIKNIISNKRHTSAEFKVMKSNLYLPNLEQYNPDQPEGIQLYIADAYQYFLWGGNVYGYLSANDEYDRNLDSWGMKTFGQILWTVVYNRDSIESIRNIPYAMISK